MKLWSLLSRRGLDARPQGECQQELDEGFHFDFLNCGHQRRCFALARSVPEVFPPGKARLPGVAFSGARIHDVSFIKPQSRKLSARHPFASRMQA